MEHTTAYTSAVDTLETLGLKQYEAECFTALTRLLVWDGQGAQRRH